MPFLPPRRVFLAAVLLAAPVARAQPRIRASALRLGPGAATATVDGRLAGPDDHVQDHLLRARGGQTLTVMLQTTSASTHFNVLPPGSDEALFRGELEGGQWHAVLPGDGEYRIRVFLNGAAARAGATARYTLTVGLQ